ncbi:polyprenyl synthetase family protein [Aerococcus sp. 1KP-2016]|uniref:polyprenyl synthetase family protein n=1 Tax=Aerococcus sp. 1KP-2016 TaxID=1981982 RepID=UPI000B994B80|nr:polyprenyl synthetase family protein [Aerococcus sp. 1KP-2016]OYQ66883.1 farnesyl pyrophosphate synthetase [Aerococcus sp. 1KP-2016]
MLQYWIQYPKLHKQLKAVTNILNDRMQVSNPDVQEALLSLNKSGGKTLRPAMFLLFAQFGDKAKQEEDRLMNIAASLEILHMATLIHDDVIDDSPLHRGQVTIQSQYGKDVAVYTGDFLFTQFFDLIIDNIDERDYIKINAQTMERILIGELNQMYKRFDQAESVEEYLENITGKTAELFWLSAMEGAHFAGTNDGITALAGSIGKNIGMAFQVLDDILDYVSDTETLKKPVLEDLAQGIYTLPLLLAKAQAPAEFAPILDKKQHISDDDAKTIAKLVHQYAGVTKAQAYAKSYTNAALDAIAQLPDIKAKKILQSVTKELLERSY